MTDFSASRRNLSRENCNASKNGFPYPVQCVCKQPDLTRFNCETDFICVLREAEDIRTFLGESEGKYRNCL